LVWTAARLPPPPERRSDASLKIRVPVEIHLEWNDTPLRGATSDIALDGCYIESAFPFSIDTILEFKLQINGTLLVQAKIVVTCDPQVGNGIQFIKMLPQEIAELKAFIAAAERPKLRTRNSRANFSAPNLQSPHGA
jgi:hypothetical protein